uniref:Ribosomal protein L22 n=1 Tax=Ormosia ferruginea TaxID=2929556 RepID=A0A8S0NMK1_9FABA|nr:ribosomal protein L22 [Ormosia ferruginea]BDH72853.1 ribosomal protein L22 [Ormosia ferruginea]
MYKDKKKRKYTNRTYHLMYSSHFMFYVFYVLCIVVGNYGTKNKSAWFQTWYNSKS